MKSEPSWMTEFRLRAYRHYLAKPMPWWANLELLEMEGLVVLSTKDGERCLVSGVLLDKNGIAFIAEVPTVGVPKLSAPGKGRTDAKQ